MKKTLLILIFSSFFITSLYAGSYIKVAAFSKTENFNGSVDSIEALGFDAAYIERHGVTRVFAGPFNNSSELNSALSIIREKIAVDAYPVEVSNVIAIAKATPKAPAEVVDVAVEDMQETAHKSVVEDSDEPMVDEKPMATEEVQKEKPTDSKVAENLKKPEKEEQSKKYFVGISAGTSTVGTGEYTITGTLPLDISLKKAGGTFGAEGGYNFDNSVFATLNYQHTELTNIKFHDIFTTLNYKFYDNEGFSPYVGALVDYNIKQWKNRPLKTLSSTDKSNQVTVGFQLGSDYYLGNDISVFALYRYIHMNYKTTITDSTNTKEIQHNNEQNFNVGLKYSF